MDFTDPELVSVLDTVRRPDTVSPLIRASDTATMRPVLLFNLKSSTGEFYELDYSPNLKH